MSQIEDNERKIAMNKWVMIDELRGYIDADRFGDQYKLTEYLNDAGYIEMHPRQPNLAFREEPYYIVIRDLCIKSVKNESSISMDVYRGSYDILKIKNYLELEIQLDRLFYA